MVRVAVVSRAEYRLLSFNIRRDTRDDGPDRWRRRRDLVSAVLRRADVAGLQEVRWRQLRDLEVGAAGYEWAGAGRADGRRRGEFVPVFWRADRFRCEDRGVFWLSRTPQRPGSRDHADAITRAATWVRLFDRALDRRLFVLNTHLDHRVEAARVEGARLVRTEIDRRAGDHPVVLLGDLNADPGSPAHRLLTDPARGRVPLHDAHDLAPTRSGPDTTLNGFEAPRPGKRIDVVLLSPHWEVVTHRIDDIAQGGRWASDHYPVEVAARL
jgi:endonuclease/exonuclease/phosphatase family metal-dependent hydrolase